MKSPNKRIKDYILHTGKDLKKKKKIMMTEVLGYNIVGGASVVLVYISKRQVVYRTQASRAGAKVGQDQ